MPTFSGFRALDAPPPAGFGEDAGMVACLYDSLPQGTVLADACGRILYANPVFFRLTECTASDLALMGFADVLSVFSVGLCRDMADLGVTAGTWHELDKPLAMYDGSLAYNRIRVDPLAWPDGRTLWRLTVENITPFKVAIEGLLTRKDLYQNIVETRSDVICCFLPDGSLTYVNAQSVCHFGPGAEVGANFLDLIPPELKPRFLRALESLTIDAPLTEFEVQLPPGPGAQDGEGRVLRWVLQGFFYRSGFLKDYQATGVDVTDQKARESQVMHADRLVSLGTLVSEVAHEISNPNNFIMLNAPLALELWEAVAPALKERAGRPGACAVLPDVLRDMPELLSGIIEGSTRITRFVHELKNYARTDREAGFEPVHVAEVVQSAVLLLNKTIGAHTTRFTVRELGPLPAIRARRQRLEQVLVNLLQNACHALTGPQQGIEIGSRHLEAEGLVEITVTDQGRGIEPEDLPRVTSPFYSTKRGNGGTGLGLSISLAIAREHGGDLELCSTPGRGTTARVVLPVSSARVSGQGGA